MSDALINRFHQLEIPYYLDEKMEVDNNELVEFINAFIAVISENFSYDALNRFLRLGLLRFDKRLVSLLDNYLLETGIKGYKRLHYEFTYLPRSFGEDELKDINEFKDFALSKLDTLYSAISKSKINIKDALSALREIFEKENIEEKLQNIKPELEARNDFKRAELELLMLQMRWV